MDIENRHSNIDVKGADTNAKTPSKANSMKTPSKVQSLTARKAIETPKSQARPTTALCSSSKTPFSPSNLSCSTNTVGSEAREAARIAKIQNTSERIKKVSELKDKWAKDKEAKAQLNKLKRENELKRLQDETEIAAELRRKALEKKKEIADKQKKEESDRLAVSLLERQYLASDLELQAKAKRRISIFLNKKIMEKSQAKEKLLEDEKKQNEATILANKRLDHLANREAKKEEEHRRRESMCNRGLKAQAERETAEALERKRKDDELGWLQTRHENWVDEKNGKYLNEQRKRESIAHRLDMWRVQKSTEEQLQQDENNRNLDRQNSRYEDWKDTQRYKDSLKQRDRESMAGRIQKWKEERDLEKQMKATQDEMDDVDKELKAQETEDIKNYKESMKASRRESLAYRLDKAKKDKDFEKGQEALKLACLAEEQRLKSEDMRDVKKYREELQNARRQSLEYRNQFEYQEKMRLEGVKAEQQAIEAANKELSDAAWRDVKEYQEKQREERRKSVAWRVADSKRRHQVELDLHSEKLNTMHDQLQSRHQDWQDVKMYKQNEKEMRRKSVAMRLDSWRIQKMASEKQKAKEALIAEEDARLREQDREALLEAEKQLKLIEKRDMLNNFI